MILKKICIFSLQFQKNSLKMRLLNQKKGGVIIMIEDSIEQVLNILGKDLHIKKNCNFIDTLFDERAEKFHISITKNSRYKIDNKKIKILQDKIFAKYDNADDIISLMEEYENASDNMRYLIEKQMYKHGIYDGIKFVIEGLKNN